MKERLNHISFLQFVGPIFVVLGHSLNGMSSKGLYYLFTKDWVYIFHMPLFFFISGYLFSYKNELKNKTYKRLITRKFWRLLFPYLLLNLLFIIPKAFLSGFIVDDVEFSLAYIIGLFIKPRTNIWGHTWFLAALFLIYSISPIWDSLMNIKKNQVLVWGITTIVLSLLFIFPINTEVLALKPLSYGFLSFWVGVMFGRVDIDKIRIFITKPIIIVCLFIMTLVFTIIRLTITKDLTITLVTCYLTIVLLFAIPFLIEFKSKVINKLSEISFGIYIMHWPLMILVRVVFYQIFHFNSNLTIILMILCGYFGPIIITYSLRKIKCLKNNYILKYLLGI